MNREVVVMARHDERPDSQPSEASQERRRKRRGHGEGSIFERKSDRKSRKKPWVAQVTLETGKKKTVGYFRTRQEAQVALRKALNELEQGTVLLGRDQSVRDYLEHWLEYVHKPSIRLTTYLLYQRILHTHILPALGNIPLRRLQPEHIERLYAAKREEGLAPKTLSNIHKLLHVALRDAVRRGKVARNVLDMVKAPQEFSPERSPLTSDQAALLAAAIKQHSLEALFLLAIMTGMRQGELLALRWQDVDLVRGRLQVLRTVSYKAGHGFVETETKTRKSRRSIFLPPLAIETLKAHQARQLEARLKAGDRWKEMDLVFCTQNGNFLTDSFVRRQYYQLLDQAGLPRIHFHDLRHSAATILLALGVPIKVVQELLGHSHVNTTLSIYFHVLPGMQEEAMRKMEEVLRGQHPELSE
ncbi:MAG: site-specific integrase [Thermogemmatispora sp.]|uniref:tyrosine-type recombinase/integrase n=1 Tax=Thermogemmatispora sp. TaxID=1968838 RepID=UPI00261C8044|nr:site-specific integrase [Thermogemmatispora sp.]MBX5456606.1 site-specific integrase [Thermogemmatispora sp.]